VLVPEAAGVPVPDPELGPGGAAGGAGGVGGAPPAELGPGSPYGGETGAIVGPDAEAAVDVGDAALEFACVGARSVGSFSVCVRPGGGSGAAGKDAVVLVPPGGSGGLVAGLVVVFVRAALTVGLSAALVSGLTGAATEFAGLVGRGAGGGGLSAGLTWASM